MKVLIVSNNCLARNNSNGRILGCLFKNFDKNDISQLYIVPGTNDFDLCANFFLISDRMMISSFLKGRTVGKIVSSNDVKTKEPELSDYRTKFGRSSLTMLCRELLWQSDLWWNKRLKDWLKNTGANVLVFQCGDSPFMYRLVKRIKKYLNIPVVLFNTEYYYFLKESWLPVKDNKLFFCIFSSILNREIKKSIESADLSIYNSDWLKEHYDVKFKGVSKVLYQSSDYSNIPIPHESETPNISYVGNLGFGRWEPLIEIANALKIINKKWKIDVYGVVQSEEVRKMFNETECLDFHGSVPYSEAQHVLSRSDLLILAENQKPHFAKATEYGFSGKITDYLYSGIPIFAYGSDSNVGISYLKETKSAMVVTDKSDLVDSLKNAVQNEDWRKKTVSTALSVACANHDALKNARQFKNYLLEVLTNANK